MACGLCILRHPLYHSHAHPGLEIQRTTKRIKGECTCMQRHHKLQRSPGFVIFKSLICLLLSLSLFPSRPVRSDKSTPSFIFPHVLNIFAPPSLCSSSLPISVDTGAVGCDRPLAPALFACLSIAQIYQPFRPLTMQERCVRMRLKCHCRGFGARPSGRA